MNQSPSIIGQEPAHTEETSSHVPFDHEDFRDPPYYRSEGPRVIEFGPCRLEYEIAPLPNGTFIARCSCATGHSGSSHGWHRFETREEVLKDVLASARRHFDISHTGSSATSADVSSCPKMLERLNAVSLFGFLEPEPLPRSEWWDAMIADRIHTMKLYRGWDLIDVVRGMTDAPSKSGSFFDIPLPAGENCNDVPADAEQDDDEGIPQERQ
jgi:hypothetical protein